MKGLISFLLILCLTFVFSYRKIEITSSIDKGNYGVIDWDNFGYYLYLPAIFIYEDIKLQDVRWAKEVQKKYSLSSNFYQAHRVENGNHVIQYTSGMAFLYSPAFIVGHSIAKLSSKYPTDGFSLPYQLAVLIQSFLMVFLGLFYLRKLSLLYFDDTITIASISLIALGTNYFQIVSANISSPHIYLFAAYAFLLYQIIKWHEQPTLKRAISIGVVLAIMILSRPNELLFLIIPLFISIGRFSSISKKIAYLLQNKRQLIALVLPLIIFGIIQPIYWRYVTGEWLHDSYKNEDFKLLKPYIVEYLFSYKKGWLLYTPIMLIGLVGFIPFHKKQPQLAKVLAIFVFFNVWVLSSWDCWWYADSFSQRSIVQSYPIFILPFGFLLAYIKRKAKTIQLIFLILVILIVALNLFQSWQMTKAILHTQNMTKEFYWNAFGKTQRQETDRSLLDINRHINTLPQNPIKKHKVIYYESFKGGGSFVHDGFRFKREGSKELNNNTKTYSPIRFAAKDLYDTSYVYLVCRVRFKSEYNAEENNFGIEFTAIDSYSEKQYHYKIKTLKDIGEFEKGKWNSIDLVVIPPVLRNESDSLSFELKHFGSRSIFLDNVSIELLDPSVLPKQERLEFQTDLSSLEIGNWKTAKVDNGEEFFQQIDSINQYSTTLEVPITEVEDKRKIRVVGKVNLEHNYSGAFVVISVNNGKKNLFYDSYSLIRSKLDWEYFEFETEIPKKLDSNSVIKVYIWNKLPSPVLIKALKVSME